MAKVPRPIPPRPRPPPRSPAGTEGRDWEAFGTFLVVVAVAALLLTTVSVVRSGFPDRAALPCLLLRYAHLFVFLYVVLFLPMVGPDNVFAVAYLVLVLAMVLHWLYFRCCLLSYYELKLIHGDDESFLHLPTTFHPTMNTVFAGYDDAAMLLIGAALLGTICVILWKNRAMGLRFKVAYALVFSAAFACVMASSRRQVMHYEDAVASF